MLERFLRGQREWIEGAEKAHASPEVIHLNSFLNAVNFVASSGAIRNQELVLGARLLLQCFEEERIHFRYNRYPIDLMAGYIPDGHVGTHMVIQVPANFADQMATNPIRQFGLLARLFSGAYEVSEGRDPQKSHGAMERANAYQAEMLLTLQVQLAERDIDVTFSRQEQKLLASYPDGLLSLPEELRNSSRRAVGQLGLN